MAHVVRSCLLVAHTSKCGHAINIVAKLPTMSSRMVALMILSTCLSSHFTFIQTEHGVINIHPNHRNFTLYNVIPSHVSRNPRKLMCLVWISFNACHISLSYITDFDIHIIHRRIQTTRSHASHCHHCHYCHYCNVDFVLFHDGTCYIHPLLLCIHVKIAYLLNMMCTLTATCMTLVGGYGALAHSKQNKTKQKKTNEVLTYGNCGIKVAISWT